MLNLFVGFDLRTPIEIPFKKSHALSFDSSEEIVEKLIM